MPYQLRSDHSFCRVDGRVVLLDLTGDRYFRLQPELERVLVAHLVEGADCTEDELAHLAALGVLTEDAQQTPFFDRVAPTPPRRSALEEAPLSAAIPFGAQLRTLVLVAKLSIALKTRALINILASVSNERAARTPGAETARSIDESGLIDAAGTFARARLAVPIETCCLLDSLSLLRFLSGRGLFARLVMGVTGSPFSAHCWVQAGDLVLNDSVGHAMAHTPIRVI
ncbi:hypothetical protein BEN78_15170 [Xanthomonas citri pv. mangiferaeindicae]|nr:hypothetical protein BEN78_15170 [Xanthomonas citri pv. mangiferaeindicae]